jgi:hypothetical protein
LEEVQKAADGAGLSVYQYLVQKKGAAKGRDEYNKWVAKNKRAMRDGEGGSSADVLLPRM